MSDPRRTALNLWNRLISGETLDEVDRQRLADLLQQDSALRDEIEADATLNALLRFMSDGEQTDDQFVQEVLDQCSAMPPIGLPNAKVDSIERQVAGLSNKPGPHSSVLEPVPLNGVQITVASKHQGRQKEAHSKRRRRSSRTAFTLAAAILACLSLAFWSLLDQSMPVARNHPTDRAVRGADKATAQPSSIAEGNNVPDRQNDPIVPRNDRPHVEPLPLEPSRQNEAIAQRSDTESQQQFVTFTEIDDPVWERKSLVGDRLGNEIVRLFAGSVELTFDKGAVVTVDGPIEFRPLSTGQLELRRGRMLASVPQKAIGFTVSTPTSKIVDLGTEFEVAVNEAGESNVQVLRGEVEVAALTSDEDNVQKWRLLPDDFHRASFFALPQIQGPVPVSASLQGRGGQFQGFVSLNGKTAEFNSPETFDQVRRRAAAELVRSQENALRQWIQFVDSMQDNMQGTMKLNGQ
ncbi:MAG: FecR family protein, partial [Planctomycetota bacterium]